MNEKELLHRIKITYQSILNEKLVGIYIHGSIAFGCFRWDVSDIDFLVVVKEKLNQEEKEALISELLALDNECPPKGFEMSVICQDACGCFQYPTPFELHFSNAHKEFALQDLAQYCRRMQGTDKDLAAHCMVIRKVGITLCGKKISEVFGEVSKEAYIDSICADIQDARTDIIENPVYIILNLCRVLAFKRDGYVLSSRRVENGALRICLSNIIL